MVINCICCFFLECCSVFKFIKCLFKGIGKIMFKVIYVVECYVCNCKVLGV